MKWGLSINEHLPTNKEDWLRVLTDHEIDRVGGGGSSIGEFLYDSIHNFLVNTIGPVVLGIVKVVNAVSNLGKKK
jgi:hypothetical protein